MEQKINNSEKRKKFIIIYAGLFLFFAIILAILLQDNRYLEIYYKISGGKIIEKQTIMGDAAPFTNQGVCLGQIPKNCNFIRTDDKKANALIKECFPASRKLQAEINEKRIKGEITGFYDDPLLMSDACNIVICVYGCFF